jgi:hypothetical protein
MSNLSELLNICVTMPNIGAFVFYLVFIFLVPLFMFVIKHEHLLGSYLVLLVPIAIILQKSGMNDTFSNLYPLDTNKSDWVGIVSKIIISLISLSAIVWQGISLSQESNRVHGTTVALTGVIIIFVLSPYLIPLVIKEGDKFIKKKGVNTYKNWHKYTFGFALLIAFIIVEVLLTMGYNKYLK